MKVGKDVELIEGVVWGVVKVVKRCHGSDEQGIGGSCMYMIDRKMVEEAVDVEGNGQMCR